MKIMRMIRFRTKKKKMVRRVRKEFLKKTLNIMKFVLKLH